MSFFEFALRSPAIKAAGLVAIWVLSASASQAQSGPFAGFNGAWSGNGTVALSDGTTERIRCKADYKVDGSGLGLKQTLRCASDSYKFDLSSDVTSQGNRISGYWSETSRTISGSLQGKGNGGNYDLVAATAGFNANISLRTSGNKQNVTMRADSQFRGANISLSK